MDWNLRQKGLSKEDTARAKAKLSNDDKFCSAKGPLRWLRKRKKTAAFLAIVLIYTGLYEGRVVPGPDFFCQVTVLRKIHNLSGIDFEVWQRDCALYLTSITEYSVEASLPGQLVKTHLMFYSPIEDEPPNVTVEKNGMIVISGSKVRWIGSHLTYWDGHPIAYYFREITCQDERYDDVAQTVVCAPWGP